MDSVQTPPAVPQVLLLHDEDLPLVVELTVVSAVGLQILSERARGLGLDLPGIRQRPQGIAQLQQELPVTLVLLAVADVLGDEPVSQSARYRRPQRADV